MTTTDLKKENLSRTLQALEKKREELEETIMCTKSENLAMSLLPELQDTLEKIVAVKALMN